MSIIRCKNTKNIHILIIIYNKSQIKNKNSRKTFVVTENNTTFKTNKKIKKKKVKNDKIK